MICEDCKKEIIKSSIFNTLCIDCGLKRSLKLLDTDKIVDEWAEKNRFNYKSYELVIQELKDMLKGKK